MERKDIFVLLIGSFIGIFLNLSFGAEVSFSSKSKGHMLDGLCVSMKLLL